MANSITVFAGYENGIGYEPSGKYDNGSGYEQGEGSAYIDEAAEEDEDPYDTPELEPEYALQITPLTGLVVPFSTNRDAWDSPSLIAALAASGTGDTITLTASFNHN